MNDRTPGRRAFLTLASRALLGAGVLAIARPDRGSGREGDSSVVTGQETFARLVTQAREHAWADRPIGERIGAVGMALRDTPYVDGTLEDDLRHALRSARAAGHDIELVPARCKSCSFVFGEDRLLKPGRCPALCPRPPTPPLRDPPLMPAPIGTAPFHSASEPTTPKCAWTAS